ncbi:hypothetical protein LCGC14_1191560 [marine sediment metagenome]|uniref:Uncharacterized protein n=1 Tax=marine sediment metagenome TaxID=412755 RepID=A0A0F9LNZ8_9ZZZZ
MTLIICENITCKHNRVNNPMQKITICHNQQIRMNKLGFCKSKEKRGAQ